MKLVKPDFSSHIRPTLLCDSVSLEDKMAWLKVSDEFSSPVLQGVSTIIGRFLYLFSEGIL